MKPFFSPEDFIGLSPNLHYQESAAQIANVRLEERGMLVYGEYADWGRFTNIDTISPNKSSTHQALLVCIEKLEKSEACEHEPINFHDAVDFKPSCLNCGVTLKATWSAE